MIITLFFIGVLLGIACPLCFGGRW